MRKYLFLVLALMVLLPQVAGAQWRINWGTPTAENPSGGILSCTGNYLNASATVPFCKSICDIFSTLKNLFDFLLTIIMFLLAPAYFVYGGFLVMTGSGNESRVSQGKDVMRRTIIGILITLSSYAIVATFLWAVGNPAPGTIDPRTGRELPRISWPNIACNPEDMPGTVDVSGFQKAAEAPSASGTQQ